jgi:formiminotetrahydrofolate cyclodeaminase
VAYNINLNTTSTRRANAIAFDVRERGWDERWEEFSDWAERGKAIHERLLQLVDEDTHAFNDIMAAFGLPKKSIEE